ncbi:Sodium:sulfate symporter transmembrane region-domain-containing protein [Dichotomocladium elegans]|nr:Sodium:sulfate symporter transmembrane region-domain-containing protein [Dichotomocladium elegans]
MKFSHQLQFNAVPDWTEYYVPYSNLKKLVYSIERSKVLQTQEPMDEETPNENTALLNASYKPDDDRFISALDLSLDRITGFYSAKETELYGAMESLLDDLEAQKGEVRSKPPRQEAAASSAQQQPLAKDLQRHAVDLFVQLSELKSFVSLNATAFQKILKKYDKVTGGNLKQSYTAQHVSQAYPFQTPTRQKLNDSIQQAERAYADLSGHGGDSFDIAINELKAHLREHIVWERNTVWRDMVGQERKIQSVGLGESKLVLTPFGTLDRAKVIRACCLVGSLFVFALLLNLDLFSEIEQNRCFAILVFASMLWATEVMPLFATAMLIPFLVVIFCVFRSPETHERLSAPAAAKQVFASMFSSVIMLLLGGFAIAGSLSKYGIAKAMATFVLSRAGSRPSRVLLVNQLVATAASMWISNVAAPVLCFSLIQPILRSLPLESNFGSCLVLGIALASNLGGIASPISSPQNIIAIQNMDPKPSWGQWFVVSIPLCLIGNVIIWLWLLFTFHPEKNTPHIPTGIRASSGSSEPISGKQLFVVAVTITTIGLWCCAQSIDGWLGDMGIIAILPLVLFFGTGLLTKDDFNNFLWNVVMLAMGGIVLGKAVESSGLLKTIATTIQNYVTGLSAFEVLVVFGSLVVVIASFISHTVAALIILPIVAEVGAEMEKPRPALLVMGVAFVCSIAMALPVSGFPNMNAISQENELGKPYLRTKDFLRNGVPASLFCLLVVTTIGYGLMDLVGF